MGDLRVREQFIETTQINRFDRDRAPGQSRRFLLQHRFDRRGRDRLLPMEQLPQRLLHQCFVLPRGQVQDPQILPIGIRRLVGPQGVVGHAEVARREQLLTVTIAGKGARLTHQPVDDVPVVDAMLVTSAQARQTLDQLLGVPHLQVLDEQAHLDLLADQPAGHRVAVAADVDQAALIDLRPQPLARLQPPRRQRP